MFIMNNKSANDVYINHGLLCVDETTNYQQLSPEGYFTYEIQKADYEKHHVSDERRYIIAMLIAFSGWIFSSFFIQNRNTLDEKITMNDLIANNIYYATTNWVDFVPMVLFILCIFTLPNIYSIASRIPFSSSDLPVKTYYSSSLPCAFLMNDIRKYINSTQTKTWQDIYGQKTIFELLIQKLAQLGAGKENHDLFHIFLNKDKTALIDVNQIVFLRELNRLIQQQHENMIGKENIIAFVNKHLNQFAIMIVYSYINNTPAPFNLSIAEIKTAFDKNINHNQLLTPYSIDMIYHNNESKNNTLSLLKRFSKMERLNPQLSHNKAEIKSIQDLRLQLKEMEQLAQSNILINAGLNKFE